MTFNMVPSLVLQIEEYAEDKAVEEPFRIAFKPASELTPEEQTELLTFAFQLNHENLLSRYPRFRELYDKARAVSSASLAAQRFVPQDLLDLQVLSQIAWFDEIYLSGDPEIRRLVVKGHGYSEEDKKILRSKELEIFKVTLEAYRKAAARGQIEISTSPLYHPILPLLCDSGIAEESRPGVRLPNHPFRHPEDAREQLRSSVRLHERVFGARPRGLWPSEGSVSDEVLRIAAEEGFEWAATDEGVLGRSLRMGFSRHGDGTAAGGQELYRPHRFQAGSKGISLFFRDHQISDLIGFVYSRMDAHAAAADLYQKVKAAGRSTARPAVIAVILDGENAWEFFPGNGREFLKNFYGRLAADPDLKALTASEALEATEQGQLTHVVPGSWINANFDVWIGAEEDNRAWDLLKEARDFFAQNSSKPGLSPQQVELARQELWISEGSDWCWWYGPEHSSAHDEEFDLLYRKHLSNIYRLLGASPPDELAVPIKRPKTRAVAVPPSGAIEPRVDGIVTNYFEWLGAGVYVPDNRSGSMHGAAAFIEALYYGYSRHSVYLRVDMSEAFREEHSDFEIRVNVDGHSRVRLHAQVEGEKLRATEFSRGEEPFVEPPPDSGIQAAFARVFELSLSYQALGIKAHENVKIQVSLWVNELPVQVIPQEGWLTLELTEDYLAW
ncbi:MAG TPA: glycoside hydrolase family 57 protein, partial [Terriglobia bacterium]|nr:glycoside hydrolase family 57 protein [Terriglobia bacterium]